MRLPAQHHKPRDVPSHVLDTLVQYLQTVQLGRLPRCNGRAVHQMFLRNHLCRAGRVVVLLPNDAHAPCVLLRLRQGLRVGQHRLDVRLRHPRQRQETVVHRHKRLPYDMQPVTLQQIVHRVDTPAQRVLHRQHSTVCHPLRQRLERVLKLLTRQWRERRTRLVRSHLAIRPRKTLESHPPRRARGVVGRSAVLGSRVDADSRLWPASRRRTGP
mmetsp:Transcript_9365/g.25352  ORF Transcript_9365/g.25352 Transcript_9365/m.25352 type:complete len:214 (+) Transcript_9365:1081-1722(+)